MFSVNRSSGNKRRALSYEGSLKLIVDTNDVIQTDANMAPSTKTPDVSERHYTLLLFHLKLVYFFAWGELSIGLLIFINIFHKINKWRLLVTYGRNTMYSGLMESVLVV